ncbi:MAG: nicotinate-nucleotide adenylyltransferase [Dehalococcoidia bacterium]|nr:nicotinate-nucleotide adenylyltransferase [Dehalococcoidia bacterium]
MDLESRVGVFGGTFDPIHLGHLVAAEEARICFRLSEVLFVPAGTPWHRGSRPVTDAHRRLDMLRLSIAANPHFRLSTVDVDRQGPTYTVDTLQALRQERGAAARFYFLIGMDALAEIKTWKDPAILINLCHLLIMPRPGHEAFDISSLEPDLPGLTERVSVLPMPLLGISSTDLRHRVRQGLPIRYQVTDQVEAYIAEHGLYKD